MDAVVIGAGPAGLMAAEALAGSGVKVTVFEGKPSPGRKFLMAGKSGLNLTKEQEFDAFLTHFTEASNWLKPMLNDFGPTQVRAWAEALGIATFTGSTKRVFPKQMKASPLLRAWLKQLSDKGVSLHSRHLWQGWQGDDLAFEVNGETKLIKADVTVLALGGASWPKLGSTGEWTAYLAEKHVDLSAFQPANMGFNRDWSDHMKSHLGRPIKSISLRCGTKHLRGEFVLTARGVEGGAIYMLSRDLREGADLHVDLLPDLSLEQVATRLSKTRGKNSLANHLRKTLRLDATKIALAQECAYPLPADPQALAAILKDLPLKLGAPRPIAEAISTAGGVAQTALDEDLMLQRLPGVFCAGEMLDWEAPTGGYLITACMASGRWAGLGAARYLGGKAARSG